MQALIRANDAARKTLLPFCWEGRVPRPDGMHWLRMESKPDLQPNGDILWNGMQHDITARVLASEEMAALVRKQQAILNNEMVGIVTVRERVIVWANTAYEQMLGYDAGEMVGAPTRQAYPSDADYRAASAAAYAALAGGGVWHARIAQVRKDGQGIWLDASGKVLDLDTGESLWTFVDVTTFRQSEAALKQKLDELERFNRAMVGRELQMVVLKQEVNELCQAAGLPARHVVSVASPHNVLGKAGP